MRSTSKRRASGAAISEIRIPTASPAGDRAVSGIRLRPALLLLLFAMLPAHASLAVPPDEEPRAVETAEQTLAANSTAWLRHGVRQRVLVNVDGVGTPDEVFARLREAIDAARA